tara:strand:+ start:138 stop:290 length:153 start_codon:yes stop_codon:yes gene_type:complete
MMQIFKELAFVYIVNGHKFIDKKEAEEYAKKSSQIQKASKENQESCNKEI